MKNTLSESSDKSAKFHAIEVGADFSREIKYAFINYKLKPEPSIEL